VLTINILNDGTGTDDSANYTFDVLVNGRKVDGGVITGHNRKDDWRMLVNLMICQNMTEGERQYQFSQHILRHWDMERREQFAKYLLGDNFDVIPIVRMTQAEWDALHDETFFEIMENTK